MGTRFWSTAGGLALAFAFLDAAAVFAADEKAGSEDKQGANLLSLKGEYEIQPKLLVRGHGQGTRVWQGEASGGWVPVAIAQGAPLAEPITAAYWTGSQDASWSTLTVSGSNTNWGNAAGVDTNALPTAVTNVFFAAPVASNYTNTTLDGNFTINSLSFNAAGAVTVGPGNVSTNTLTIGGAGGITVNAGAGAATISAPLVLGAAQTWTNNSSSLMTISGGVANGGNALTLAGSGNTAISGAISGNGTLTKAGPGTLTLAGNITYSGQTLLSGGTLVMNAPPLAGLYEGLVSNTNWADTTDPIPHSSIQPVARWGASTSTDANNDANTNVYPYWGNYTTWGYSGYLFNRSSSAVTYNFGKNFDDGAWLVIDGVSVISDGVYNSNVTGSIILVPGLHTVDLRFGQYNGGVGPNSGAYSSFGIAYNTVGNTGTGGTWVQMGASDPNTQFYATNGGGAPSTSVVMASNTTLDLSASNALSLVALRSLADAPGSPTGHQVLLGGNTLETGLDNSSTKFSGVISGSGGLIKQGIGTFTLSGANTYTGGTTVNSGTLNLAHPLAVQNSTVNVSFSGALSFAAGNTNPTFGGLTGYGNVALATAASERVTLNVGNNNQSTTYGGSLSGAGGLTKIGSGVLTLTASNSYANGTTIAGGTVKIINSCALGSGPVVLAGGTLSMAVVPPSDSIGVHFVGNGASVAGSAGVVAMNNWDNLSGSTFAGVTLSDNNGATTTANLTTVNANGPSASGSSNQLLNGYIYSVNSPLSATITGIPYSQYSLYAYMVDATIGNSEEVIIGGKTYYFGTTNSASYMQITNTTPGSYPTGNYAVATGLTGNTQTVTVQGLNQPYGPLAGFEIVHTAPTTLPSNAVTLSSDSTIDVTGPANGSITGLFTIGGNRLSLSGGGSGANTAYSLTLGNSGGVSIIGNPTFDVANNGSGTGTLILGALNDGGTTRTITKSDLGALTLGAAASAMNADDIVNINGGTLKSNNATALGTRTAVNVASGATFALGASQALGALGDSGTVVVNGASVQLNGNALTVGSGNNLSSTFSGVIANGTGGAGSLVKAGAGSLVLRGNNTYTGPTTVSQGDLLVNGSLASPVTVTSGGILGGMGSLILLRKFRAICSG